MYMSTFAALLTLGLHSNQKLPVGNLHSHRCSDGCCKRLIMGLLVTKLKIHAFIASIGMQLVLKGIMYVYCNGSELSIGRDYDLNEKLNNQLLPFLPFSTYLLSQHFCNPGNCNSSLHKTWKKYPYGRW